jgi:hypothetical protein
MAFGQAPIEAPAPLWKVDPLGQGVTLGQPCASYEDDNGPLLIGNPLLDGPTATPGWVAGLELGIVGPHIVNHLSAEVTRASGATDPVHLPTAELGVGVMPRFELGYRWGQATGELIFSYRFLLADTAQQLSATELPAFAPTGATVRSRLDVQVFDLDYGSHEPLTVFGVDMKWRAGLHGLIYFSDSSAADATLFQRTSNSYWGLGPHAMADFRRPIRGTGLNLFGRIEAAIPFGQVRQRYVETVTAGGSTDSGLTDLHIDSQITSVAFQAGVSWTPPWNPNFHVTAGYMYEHFFYLGTTNVPGSPTEELSIQGGFLRAEWNY